MINWKQELLRTEDHCGAKITGFWSWLLATLIPDSLWGVSLMTPCVTHDIDYEVGGTEKDRKEADQAFRDAVFVTLLDGKVPWLKAKLASKAYYLGVRKGGAKSFNYKCM